MSKLTNANRRAGTAYTVAIAALLGSAAGVAGPGCMSAPMAGGYHPHGYAFPHGYAVPPTAYPQRPLPAYHASPGPQLHTVAPYYQRPWPVMRGNLRPVARSAALPHYDYGTAGSGEHSASSAGQDGAENITVRISGMRFEPANITVKPGTTVTWIHESSMPHTITGNADGPRSGTLNAGQQFSHTFDAAGRFDYVCSLHPSMQGSVSVEAEGEEI